MGSNLSKILTNWALVAVASVCFSVFLLLIERSVGLGWDFHPDALHYISTSKTFAKDVFKNADFSSFLNVGYYIFIDSIGSIIELAIVVNVLFFALTNVLFFHGFWKFSKRKFGNRFLYWPLVSLILFDPYRVHLSISVLKDTFILFFTLMLLYAPLVLRLLVLAPLASLRVIAPAYLFLTLRRKVQIFLIFSAIGAFFIVRDIFISYLAAMNFSSMQLRDFDAVPNFFEYGVLGAFFRSLLWPFFYLSGLFLFLSPAPLFFPIFFQVIVVVIFRLLFLRQFPWMSIFLLAGISLVVSGFTAYVRYAVPILYLGLMSDLLFSSSYAKLKNA